MDYTKLASSLCTLLKEHELRGLKMLQGHLAVPAQLRPQGFAVADDNTLSMTVFIDCDAGASLGHLSGVVLRSDGGPLRTADVTIEGLRNLTAAPEVRYLSPSLRLKPLMDKAAAATGLADWRAGLPDLTGSGVLIGLIDTGIDAGHSMFAGRIRCIWDQTLSGTGAAYGRLLEPPHLEESRDVDGHGTHLAGICAGGAHAQYAGVAPEAGLVVVKTDFQSARIADAVRFVFTLAEKENLPAVVNLAAGGHFDAHDGTDELSRFIDHEIKDRPGRIVVAAAGNEAREKIRARVELVAGESKKIIFTVPGPPSTRRPKQMILSGCYDAPSSCLLEINTPPMTINYSNQFANPAVHAPYPGINAEVYWTRPRPVPLFEGRHEFVIDARRFNEPGTTGKEFVINGEWDLKFTNNGPADIELDVWAWVPEGSLNVEFAADHHTPGVMIGAPGCAREAITVASYASRAEPEKIDRLSEFSSAGPLRDGTPKPDLTAPGESVVAACSGQMNPPPASVVDGAFVARAGTSAAAAFVTGVCALLLQHDPRLTPAQVKDWLVNRSRRPGDANAGWDERWGHGLVRLDDWLNPP